MNTPKLFNPHALDALEDVRDLLCAFRRDQPSKYQPMVDDALRTSLAIIERNKAVLEEPTPLMELLEEWIHMGECFCSEYTAFRGPCTFCKTTSAIRQWNSHVSQPKPQTA